MEDHTCQDSMKPSLFSAVEAIHQADTLWITERRPQPQAAWAPLQTVLEQVSQICCNSHSQDRGDAGYFSDSEN